MGMRVCAVPGCPTLTPAGTPRCPTHTRDADRARGSRQQRGYGRTHDQLRRAERHRVDQGGVTCWRCGKPLEPGQPFDLGHDDHDRTLYRGPEHVPCNRATNGRISRGA